MEEIILNSDNNEATPPNHVQGEKEIAIKVKDAVKSYPPHVILKEFNMTVRKGEM